jgi:hypothetical protein
VVVLPRYSRHKRSSGTRYVNVGSTNYTFDAALKQDIEPLGRLLEKLGKSDAQGHTFRWRADASGKNKRRQGRCVGLLAQEVQALCPKAVEETDDGLAYEQTALNAITLQLIRDLRSDLEELKQRVAK